ncbi:MAG: DUF2399 domain-containing protein [Oceanospirillales bacterium]|nr:DUF2399 domain-containing protein [Oceanospirillales bacterium]
MNDVIEDNIWVSRLEQQALVMLPRGRKKVVFKSVFDALMALYGKHATHPDTPRQLKDAIDKLLMSDHWRAEPVNRKKWHVLWRGVAVPAALVQGSTTQQAKQMPVAWHNFLAERITGNLTPAVTDKLLQLNEYLLSRSRAGQPLFEGCLGHRERALQIFGDEKALEALPSSGWQNVNLTLMDMQCTRKAPPVPFEAVDGVESPPLVVENSDTYHTLCEINREYRRWRAVIYGAGNLATSQAEGITSLLESWGMDEVLYCGDLDLVGLHIAGKLRKRLGVLGIHLCLDMSLYEAMIRSGYEGEEGKANHVPPNSDFDHHTEWIPERIQQVMDDLIYRRRRIAQESLALASLMS